MDDILTHKDKRAKVYGFIGTIIVHGILILILLWMMLHTPIPPYPEGGGGPGMGIEVNLGNSQEGMGLIQQKEVAVPDFKEASQQEVTKTQADEKLLTDESEESEPIAQADKPAKKKTKAIKLAEKKIKKTKDIAKNEEVQTKPVLNQKALYKSKPTNQGETGKPGDQGDPNGNAGAATYKGNGSGSGGGTGGGSGKGTGTGVGDGVSFTLEGRNPISLPTPEYNHQVEGIVVVDIAVDQNGNVTNAIPGVKGSTTLDDYLLEVARKAALKAKFDKKTGAVVQKGVIRYHFMLQ